MNLTAAVSIFHFQSQNTHFTNFALICIRTIQIGRFIGLWATFQSLWQQLFCPNLTHSLAIFVKVSKSLIFLVKSLSGNFYRHLATFLLVTLMAAQLDTHRHFLITLRIGPWVCSNGIPIEIIVHT